jgi:O-methyltransferase
VHGRETAAILDAYDFTPFSSVADIGGGNGSNLIELLQRHPRLQGTLFDLPGVIGRAGKNIEKAGLSERIHCVDGDFFASIPAGADAYFMRHIIHDWDDEKSITILKNVRQVLPAHGRVLLVEAIVEAGNAPSMAKSLDLTMLLLPGGQERTVAEYEQLFAVSGLKLARIVPTASDTSVIEAVPA